MARESARPSHSLSLPPWAALCFFASGAAGLLYEIVWSKQLAYLLGSSLHAVATVAAAFLCGLAIGARVLGVPLARRGNGARTYALLELGVALLGVGLLPVLRGMEPVFGHFYRQFGGESAGFAIVRFVMLFVVLLPPTVLMGATLPVLVGHFEKGLVGPALARLYALNTFGAVAGSALGGFVLMPGLGLAGSTYVAGAINLCVGALAWFAGGANAAAHAPAPARAQAPPAGRAKAAATPTAAGTWFMAVLFALSGFSALAFQIAWVRLFSLVFGSSVYSFAGVLGVYLFGLALGSALVAFLLARGAGVMLFARLQLVLAAVAAVGLHSFSRLPDQMFDLAMRSGGHWGALFAGQLGLIALLVLVPCALLGAVFPVATRLLQRGDGGHAAGFAYAVNTVGTIAGSLVAGFVLVPVLGVQGTHLAALLLTAAIGLAALGLARARAELKGGDLLFALVALVVIAGAAWTAPPWNAPLMSAGSFRPVRARELASVAQAESPDEGSLMQRATHSTRLLYYKEGENGSVLVGSDPSDKVRWLQVGGKIDASTNDMETQVLLGLLPAAFADSGARTLVIGLGSGYTASSVLAAGAGETDVVELERGVVEASAFFHTTDRDPLRDPRVHLVVADARTHLEHTRTRYGVIVSEPSNPWIAGVNNLFTVDFYRRVRERLAPDGVFCQWMQLYEISPETIRSMMASYLKVFPEGQVFTIWRAVDVLLIATPHGRPLALDRLRSPEARRMLATAHIASPEDVASYWTGSLASLEPLARGATLNRDDRPIVEYRAPRDLVVVGQASLGGDPGAMHLVPFETHMPEGPVFSAWTRPQWYALRARHLIALPDPVRARAAISGARADGLAALADQLGGEVEAGVRRGDAEDACKRGIAQVALGQVDDALRTLETAVTLDPTDRHAWLLLADRRRIAGNPAGAESALGRVTPGEDAGQDADAAVLRGLLSLTRRDTVTALAQILSAEKLAPANARAYVFEARLRVAMRDRAGAVAAVQRGLGVLPGNPELTDLAGKLGR